MTLAFTKKGPAAPSAPVATTPQPQTQVAPPSDVGQVEAPPAPSAEPAPAPAVAAPKTRKRRSVKEVDLTVQAQEAEIARLKAQLAAQQAAPTAAPAAPAAPPAPTPAPVAPAAPEAAPAPPAPAPAAPETPEQVDKVASEACGIPPAHPEAPAVQAEPGKAPLPFERALAVSAPANLPARREDVGALPFDKGSDDQIEASDLKLSKIHIVQQLGELAREFRPGCITYNRQLMLFQLPKQGEPVQASNAPVQFVVLGFKPKRWAERTQGGDGRIAYSKEEVVAFGGAFTFSEAKTTGRPWFQTLSTAVILLRKPEWLESPEFGLNYNGSLWTFAEWAMKGGSYTHGAKEIYSRRRVGSLSSSWTAHTWNLSTRFVSYPTGTSAYVPVLRPGGECPAAFQQWIRDILTGKNTSEFSSDDVEPMD